MISLYAFYLQYVQPRVILFLMRRLRNAEIKPALLEWVKEDGTRIVRRRLREKGISPSTAQKLTNDKYPHELGDRMADQIREALLERIEDKAS